MKKLSLYVFLVLMWCNVGVAGENQILGGDKVKFMFSCWGVDFLNKKGPPEHVLFGLSEHNDPSSETGKKILFFHEQVPNFILELAPSIKKYRKTTTALYDNAPEGEKKYSWIDHKVRDPLKSDKSVRYLVLNVLSYSKDGIEEKSEEVLHYRKAFIKAPKKIFENLDKIEEKLHTISSPDELFIKVLEFSTERVELYKKFVVENGIAKDIDYKCSLISE